MKKFLIITAVLFLLFVACKKDEKDTAVSEDSLKISLADSTKNQDEEVIYDKERTLQDTEVVFFMPSPPERKRLEKLYGNGEAYDFPMMFNKFLNLQQSVKRSLQKHNIPVDLSYAQRFVFIINNKDTIDTTVYDLKIEDQIMGYILFDGVNNPLIKNGVQSRKQTTNDLRNYFNIPNFRLNE